MNDNAGGTEEYAASTEEHAAGTEEYASDTNELTGVVLAGGFSRRFGETDKALARVGGTPLLVRVVSRLGEVAEEVVVNCRGDQREEFEAALGRTDVPVRFAEDPATDRGPLFGFRVALDRVETERCALAACDTPFLDPELLSDLACRLDSRLDFEAGAGTETEAESGAETDAGAETEGRAKTEAAVAAVRTPDGRVQPTGAIYRTSPAAAACADLLDGDERRLSALFDRLTARTVPAEAVAGDADRCFFDVDIPADRERAAELVEKQGKQGIPTPEP